VRLLEVLAVGALPFVQVGDGVQPEPVDAQVQPEPQHLEHGVLDLRVLVVQVRLVGEEPVPVVLAADLIEGPVGLLGVDEDDPGVGVAVIGVGPDVEVAERALGVGPRGLEPGMLVAGVVHDQVGDDPDAALVSLFDQLDEVPDVPELGEYQHEIRDVVAAVAQRRLVDGQQPEAVNAEPLQVVEPGGETADVARAVAVRVVEAADQHLVEHRVLVPARVTRLGERERVGHRLTGRGGRTGLEGRQRLADRPERRWPRLCLHYGSPWFEVRSSYVLLSVTSLQVVAHRFAVSRPAGRFSR